MAQQKAPNITDESIHISINKNRLIMDIEKKCQWCGKTFIAHSFNARFCSKQCIDTDYKHKERMKKMKEYEVELLKNSDYIPIVSKKNFLTPTEAAKLLGVGRSTFYRYLSSNTIKARQFRGKTLSDVPT